MEAMRRPKTFRYLYVTVVVYTLLIMIPSSVAVYWAYGDILLNRGNAISVLPPSTWRTFAIACMIMHQVSKRILLPIM